MPVAGGGSGSGQTPVGENEAGRAGWKADRLVGRGIGGAAGRGFAEEIALNVRRAYGGGVKGKTGRRQQTQAQGASSGVGRSAAVRGPAGRHGQQPAITPFEAAVDHQLGAAVDHAGARFGRGGRRRRQ